MAWKSESALQPSTSRVPRGVGRPAAPTYRGIERHSTAGTHEGSVMNTDKRKPIVWVANVGGHQYDKAEQFGRLMPLTSGNVNYYNLDRVMVSVSPKLAMAEADDYLLVSGSPILVGLIMSMWLTRFGRINLLQWSQVQENYVPIILRRDAVERMSTQDLEQAS